MLFTNHGKQKSKKENSYFKKGCINMQPRTIDYDPKQLHMGLSL